MKVLNTTKAPAALGPYSQGLAYGDLVFVSGQIPVNPETGAMPDTIEEQTRQSIANLEAILAEQGMTLANVIKTTVFMQDLGNFAEMNAVYGELFSEPFPARSCVQAAAIPKGAGVEIECIAVK